MALTSTMYKFALELSDVERHVYDTLELRCALHPSEKPARLVLRVLAYCLFYHPDQHGRLAFGRGLSTPDDAALAWEAEDSTLRLWIDMGAPSAARLHKASKAAQNVAVVTTRDDSALRAEWQGKTIFRADAIDVLRFERTEVAAVADALTRNERWVVTHHDGQVHVSGGKGDYSLSLRRTTVAACVG